MNPSLEEYSEAPLVPRARGKIALDCSGMAGIITSDELQYVDGLVAYVGVCLSSGAAWRCRSPYVLGTFHDFLASGQAFYDWSKRRTDA